jgi:hypothetical protein
VHARLSFWRLSSPLRDLRGADDAQDRAPEHELICGKLKCRSALQYRSGLGRYLPSSDAVSPSKKPVNKGSKQAPERYRALPWRVVAAGGPTVEETRADFPDGSISLYWQWSTGTLRSVGAKAQIS